MIKNVYFFVQLMNFWGRIDPEAQKCKQETKINRRLSGLFWEYNLLPKAQYIIYIY